MQERMEVQCSCCMNWCEWNTWGGEGLELEVEVEVEVEVQVEHLKGVLVDDE